ncbi:O-antigen polymerase [Anabaena sp. WFMT]|uniref:O-antigen polymerase n=1 Tax=Anabaena sp. WFMT TaxID=3449730 RepID=UPI003F2150C0
MDISTNSHHPQQNPPNLKKRIAKATWSGTFTLIFGLLLAFIRISVDMSPSFMANQVAIIVGVVITISIVLDSRRGWKNLFRADILCLLALYFLTLIEFLYPQPKFDQRLTSEQTIQAIEVLMIGFSGLAIGRHITFFKPAPPEWLDFGNIPDKTLFRIFCISAFLAYFYILMSVDFNPVKVIESLLGSRFAVPWGRGKLGDWRVFLSELKLFTYVIPPLTGIIWNRRQSFRLWQIFLVMFVFVFTLFYGFSGGTRNVLAAYIATFMAAYFLTLQSPTLIKLLIPTAIMGYAMVFATRHMLGFREMGIINYLATAAYASEKVQDTLSVDYNLWSIGLLVDAFPNKHDFLGLELLFVFLTKPIPRVLWPDKPEGLSTSIEQVVGADGWTVSATYIGESYMMGGIFAVILVSICLGILANWWSRTAAFHTTGYGIVVNALGFFTAAISMRSLIVFTTSMLPIVGLIFIAKTFPGLLGVKRLRYQYQRK